MLKKSSAKMATQTLGVEKPLPLSHLSWWGCACADKRKNNLPNGNLEWEWEEVTDFTSREHRRA